MTDLQRLAAHDKDLGGGFLVRRSLPSAARQAVGPFLFFDHFGPTVEPPGNAHDVRPHPHIGLATVTYLFDGAMTHRDSTGIVQRIEPGAVNWMVAGRGIVHSERAPEDLVARERTLHGLQLWCALPAEREDDAASFTHVEAASLPAVREGGATRRVLVGEAFGMRSPAPTASPTLYLDLALDAGAALKLEPLVRERALYGVDAPFRVDGTLVEPRQMVVLPEGATVTLDAPQPARLVLVGGEPLGRRFLWWNFVASSRERIVQAADDWEQGRFAKVPGETEFIPLPEKRFS